MTTPSDNPSLFDSESSPCPRCGLPVAWKWALGPRGGFMAEPHNVLVADIVFHAECWDALIEKYPPGDSSTDEECSEF